MSTDVPHDAPAGQDRGATFPVAHHEAEAAVDAKCDDGATDNLLLRLAPFDVVERHREAWRRCGYMEYPYRP